MRTFLQATGAGPCFPRRSQAEEEVVGVVLVTGMQDVPGSDLQGIVFGTGHRAAGTHLVAPGDPALPGCVLLQRGPMP